MLHKNIPFRRHTARTHKARRMFIGLHCMYWSGLDRDIRWQGQLVKGKIHCSCPLCSCKSTTDRGITTNSFAGYSISDKRKLMSLNDSLKDYERDA